LKFRDIDGGLFFSFDFLPSFDIVLMSTRNIWDPNGVNGIQNIALVIGPSILVYIIIEDQQTHQMTTLL
jgi:hypothetical protein